MTAAGSTAAPVLRKCRRFSDNRRRQCLRPFWRDRRFFLPPVHRKAAEPNKHGLSAGPAGSTPYGSAQSGGLVPAALCAAHYLITQCRPGTPVSEWPSAGAAQAPSQGRCIRRWGAGQAGGRADRILGYWLLIAVGNCCPCAVRRPTWLLRRVSIEQTSTFNRRRQTWVCCGPYWEVMMTLVKMIEFRRMN
jgi:hypothetical protein